jgi:hypothetical protein
LAAKWVSGPPENRREDKVLYFHQSSPWKCICEHSAIKHIDTELFSLSGIYTWWYLEFCISYFLWFQQHVEIHDRYVLWDFFRIVLFLKVSLIKFVIFLSQNTPTTFYLCVWYLNWMKERNLSLSMQDLMMIPQFWFFNVTLLGVIPSQYLWWFFHSPWSLQKNECTSLYILFRGRPNLCIPVCAPGV